MNEQGAYNLNTFLDRAPVTQTKVATFFILLDYVKTGAVYRLSSDSNFWHWLYNNITVVLRVFLLAVGEVCFKVGSRLIQ